MIAGLTTRPANGGGSERTTPLCRPANSKSCEEKFFLKLISYCPLAGWDARYWFYKDLDMEVMKMKTMMFMIWGCRTMRLQ